MLMEIFTGTKILTYKFTRTKNVDFYGQKMNFFYIFIGIVYLINLIFIKKKISALDFVLHM